ncbi:MAG: recombinase family protein, partial [Butyrivibrio sp.]|nr:recombinase family protein [Butyrivibrio sp.]
MEALICKTYHAAVYLRLSKEDGEVAGGGKAQSNSISNQKGLVMDYLKSHADIQVYSVYVDDGWSGVDFERPEFQRMLDDIREGAVDCVVVKDLSRFGRNYIESGRYIEKIFPMLGVRFIAVNDGYDSLDGQYGSDMLIPFKNLVNDAYCRDISVKIRSHMDIKRKNGEYIGAFAAYGYLKDAGNKNHLVVDGYAADVVRDIFAMKLCGMGVKAIAEKLNRDGILSPLQYKKSIGIRLETSFQKNPKAKWSYNAVLRVLKNEVYVGTVV